jgi:hypothetical protein
MRMDSLHPAGGVNPEAILHPAEQEVSHLLLVAEVEAAIPIALTMDEVEGGDEDEALNCPQAHLFRSYCIQRGLF